MCVLCMSNAKLVTPKRVRVAVVCRGLTSTRPTLQNLNWPSLEIRRTQTRLVDSNVL